MQKIKVYMNTGYNSETLQLSQYDVGVPFQVELYEGSTPYAIPEGALIGIEGTNADGTVFSYIDAPAVIMDVSDNLITFKSTRGMTGSSGDATAEISIITDTMRYSSQNFTIEVEPKAMTPDAFSGNEMNYFENIRDEVIRRLQNLDITIAAAQARFDTAVATAEASADSAAASAASASAIVSSDLVDVVFPVGRYWISDAATDPGAIVGGTWQRLEDCFLLAAGTDYAAGTTGGEAEHTLTIAEMPKHRHDLTYIAYRDKTASGNMRFVTEWDHFRPRASDDAFFTNEQGEWQAHNNMPPYKSVYVFVRIA